MARPAATATAPKMPAMTVEADARGVGRVVEHHGGDDEADDEVDDRGHGEHRHHPALHAGEVAGVLLRVLDDPARRVHVEEVAAALLLTTGGNAAGHGAIVPAREPATTIRCRLRRCDQARSPARRQGGGHDDSGRHLRRVPRHPGRDPRPRWRRAGAAAPPVPLPPRPGGLGDGWRAAGADATPAAAGAGGVPPRDRRPAGGRRRVRGGLRLPRGVHPGVRAGVRPRPEPLASAPDPDPDRGRERRALPPARQPAAADHPRGDPDGPDDAHDRAPRLADRRDPRPGRPPHRRAARRPDRDADRHHRRRHDDPLGAAAASSASSPSGTPRPPSGPTTGTRSAASR